MKGDGEAEVSVVWLWQTDTLESITSVQAVCKADEVPVCVCVCVEDLMSQATEESSREDV